METISEIKVAMLSALSKLYKNVNFEEIYSQLYTGLTTKLTKADLTILTSLQSIKMRAESFKNTPLVMNKNLLDYLTMNAFDLLVLFDYNDKIKKIKIKETTYVAFIAYLKLMINKIESLANDIYRD